MKRQVSSTSAGSDFYEEMNDKGVLTNLNYIKLSSFTKQVRNNEIFSEKYFKVLFFQINLVLNIVLYIENTPIRISVPFHSVSFETPSLYDIIG